MWEDKKRDVLSPEHIPDYGRYPGEEWIMGLETKKEKKKNATLPVIPVT